MTNFNVIYCKRLYDIHSNIANNSQIAWNYSFNLAAAQKALRQAPIRRIRVFQTWRNYIWHLF